MAGPLQILIADDHALFRKGFALLMQDRLAEAKVIEAAGFDAALDILAGVPSITIAFFDLMMPGMAGAESITAVRETYPELCIAAVTGLENRTLALQVIDAGANGYLLKSASEEEMVRAVNRLLAGEIYLPSAPAYAADTKTSWSLPYVGLKAERIADLPLTQRQRDVMGELASGLSNKEIARRLGLAEGTVKVHLAAIFRVLSARNRTEAVLKASKLVSSEP